MKNLLVVVLVLVLAGISQATIYTNACDDFQDGQWYNCAGFTFSNEASSISDDGLRLRATGTGNCTFAWLFADGSWTGNNAVTTADTFQADMAGAGEFIVQAYISGNFYTLMDYTQMNPSAWTHYTFNMPVAGNLDFITAGFWNSGVAVIDNVVLTPEPATMALMSLASIFVLRRKK